MRASKVVDKLPEFTQALLNISGFETVESGVSQLTYPDDSDSLVLRELDDREGLSAASDVARSVSRQEDLEEYNLALIFSLGALVRFSRITDELSRKEKRTAGKVVKSLAPFAIDVATRSKFGFFEISTNPRVLVRGDIAIQRSPSEVIQHISDHPESYETLLPLMEHKQRLAIKQQLAR